MVSHLLILGDRPGARRAARRLGRPTVVLPADTSAAHALDACQGLELSAVLAAAERSVLPAAEVRAARGLAGLDLATARRCSDKALMKEAVRAAGVPCTDWETIERGTDMDAVVDRLGLPLVVKHRSGSGCRGLVVAQTRDEAREAAGDDCLAERFVEGEEMSLEAFVFDGRILFLNPTEYFVPRFANIAPAALDDAALGPIAALNAAAVRALGVERAMTHCEIFRTPGGPLFSELAVRPPGGRIMRLLRRAYEFDPWRVWIEIERGREPGFPTRARRTAGAWMLHPGPGRVRAVRGIDAARSVTGIRKLVCRIRPGDVIEPREGTGQDVGWIEATGRTRDAVARILTKTHEIVRIELESDPSGATNEIL